MKARIPAFQSDAEAERFVAAADLTRFDLSGAPLVRFEMKPKDKSINLRMPLSLFDAVREETRKAGIPYQRFIRFKLNTVHLQGDMVGQTIGLCRLPGSRGDRPRKARVCPTK
jgi:predicted DNA binding CopG/RHH family protein